MKSEMNEASRWRIDLSRELSAHYSAHPQVRMVCLGGSSSKGISDAYSAGETDMREHPMDA